MATLQPTVTVIIPVRNEDAFIRQSLAAVLTQDYPSDHMEVLVIDGGSNDNTREIVQAMMRDYPILHLLDNPQKITPAALNVGVRHARGKYIIRVDSHTIVAPDYVRQCVALLDTTDAVNVGGLMQPVGQTYVGQAVALSTTSPFGIGDSKFHYDAREQYVDTVYMGAFRREIFDKAGLFDEELIRNQDYELNIRIREAGEKILLSPKIVSSYTPRSSLSALWRQYFQYGRWKVRTLQKHPQSLRWRQTIPALFVGSFFISFLLGLGWTPALWMFGFILSAYLLTNLVASTMVASRGGWQYLPVLPVVFATIHFSWGLGFWYGIALALLGTNRHHK